MVVVGGASSLFWIGAGSIHNTLLWNVKWLGEGPPWDRLWPTIGKHEQA